MKKNNWVKYSTPQLVILVILRVTIGYHFLFEGIDKLFTPGWTSAGFLLQSDWIFSDLFHSIVDNPALLNVINLLNIWGQIIIGFALIAGLFTRTSALMGALLLLLYYVAVPPFAQNNIFVDRNFLELLACLVTVFFNTGNIIGLDLFVKKFRGVKNG